MTVSLHFEGGTLVAPALPDDASLRALMVHDGRTGVFRAPAHHYRAVRERLQALGVAFEDHAGDGGELGVQLVRRLEPYPHQQAALEAWLAGGARGVVELPTGAGKTFLAVLALARVRRRALVVVPTLDLLAQWQRVLSEHLSCEVGAVGGGTSDRRDVTVTTYDSAALHIELTGNRFGFLVCDECHHLPAPGYRFIAQGAVAPFRLGLSATFERADGQHRLAEELLGPLVYRAQVSELSGRYLAPYDVRPVEVALTADEQRAYDEARGRYLAFARKSGVSFGTREGWARFMAACMRCEEGRAAWAGYREQRRIALSSSGKMEALFRILLSHRADGALVFCDDTETVYRLSRLLRLPALTHLTPLSERKALLAAFGKGELPALLTAKVLNEGVDLPDARVGVVLAGSGGVREHVQRLGRLLRSRPGKRAVLYEVCSRGTAEEGMSERRRRHEAYRGKEAPC